MPLAEHGAAPSTAHFLPWFPVLNWSLFSPVSGGLGEGATAQRDTPSPERSGGCAEVTSPAVRVEMVAPPVRGPPVAKCSPCRRCAMRWTLRRTDGDSR